MDLPHVEFSLRDGIPHTSKQAINRNASQLSWKTRMAGLKSANWAEDGRRDYDKVEGEAM